MKLTLTIFCLFMTSISFATSNSPTDKITTATSSLDLNAIAKEAVMLELSGWRLVDPPKKCLDPKDYKFFAAVSQGNTEAPDGKVTKLSPQEASKIKILSITKDKDDKSVHHVVFKVGKHQDKLSFVVNAPESGMKNPVSMARTSKKVFVNQSCLSK